MGFASGSPRTSRSQTINMSLGKAAMAAMKRASALKVSPEMAEREAKAFAEWAQKKSFAQISSDWVGSAYHGMMKNNAKYVLNDVSAVKDFPKQYIFTHLAQIPKFVTSVSAEAAAVRAKMQNLSNISVQEAATGLVFGLEAYALFCVGEIVGRGFSLTGYEY